MICSDDKERIPLPPAPFVAEFDPSKHESNEEFIGRLKHMGKSKRNVQNIRSSNSFPLNRFHGKIHSIGSTFFDAQRASRSQCWQIFETANVNIAHFLIYQLIFDSIRITNTIDRQRLTNDFDSDDDPMSINSNNPVS